jgi:hypothetical protein
LPLQLVLLRQCMTPGVKLMHDMLAFSGKEWERQSCLHGLRSGTHRHRILECFRGALTAPCFRSLRDRLFDRKYWDALRPVDRNTSSSSLAFRLLSCAIGSITCLVGHPDTVYPFKLFHLVLERPEGLQEFLDAPSCTLDAFSQDFRGRFPTIGELQSARAKLCLFGLSSLAKIDTAPIEARHATVRRALLRAVQTWRRIHVYCCCFRG